MIGLIQICMALVGWLWSADLSFRIILFLFLAEFIDEFGGWWLFFPITFVLTICTEFLSQVRP